MMIGKRWIEVRAVAALVTIAGVAIAGSACEGGDSPASSESTTTSTTPAAVGPAEGDDQGGISTDEAERNGTDRADFDALATYVGPDEEGRYKLALENAGRLADTYAVVVEAPPGAVATVEPAQLSLEPDGTATLYVAVKGSPTEVQLAVTSEGRGGEEVIRQPVVFDGG